MSNTPTTKPPEPLPLGQRFLTPVEAAGIVGASKYTLLEDLRAGRLTGYRPGGRGNWRILETDLYRWAMQPPTGRGSGPAAGGEGL
jgi:excisionase family DNA binding protein